MLLNASFQVCFESSLRGGGGALAAFLMVIMGAYLFSVKGKLIVT